MPLRSKSDQRPHVSSTAKPRRADRIERVAGFHAVNDQTSTDAGVSIAHDGGRRTQDLFGALMETRAIYLGQNTDGVASNARRARLTVFGNAGKQDTFATQTRRLCFPEALPPAKDGSPIVKIGEP